MRYDGPFPAAPVATWQTLGDAAAAVLSGVVLLTAARIPAIGVPLLTVLAGLVALTAWRPHVALLVLGFAIPIVRWAGRPLAAHAAWPELLVVAFCTGWFLRGVARSRPRDDLDGPVAVAAAAVLASLAVVTAIQQWTLTGFVLPRSWLQTYWNGYFLMESSGNPIDTAMRLVESLVLFRAATRLTSARPILGVRLFAVMVAGGAVAAALNVAAVVGSAPVRTPMAVVGSIASARLNIHYSDLNAAGSYFVLVLPVAWALARQSAWKLRWILAALLITLGLWLSGSRTALIAGILAALLPIIDVASRRGVRHLRLKVVGTAAILISLALSMAYLLPHRFNQRSANVALEVRWHLTLASLRMFASAPVFGVGPGNYYNLSGKFVDKAVYRHFPQAEQENAHNNYLQLLAELGIVGFATCAWLAWSASRRLQPLLDSGALAIGALTGIVAFGITCLAGHPLLIDEPAFSLALLVGIAAGLGGVPAPHPAGAGNALPVAAAATKGVQPRNGRPKAAAIAIWILIATIPVRFYSLRAAMDLENIAFGLTGWYRGQDGVDYRLSGRTCTLYLPSSYRGVTIPIRATHPHSDVDVIFRLDGEVIGSTRLGANGWQVARLAMPPSPSAGRFRRLDIEVTTPVLTPRVLYLGRITPS